MFKRLLIANRGEIACRIMETARHMGIETYAIYSDIDRKSLHVKMADRAMCVGSDLLSESYLNIENIVAVALKAGVDAIHPGYGFLSENPEFVKACETAGLAFVGPTSHVIRDMGSKQLAKTIAEQAGVPTIPGYTGDLQDLVTLTEQARNLGCPLMIKAIMGGGGKGMRRVEGLDHFPQALESCKREAKSAFGDDRVLLEKCILQARHIEVQVFGDHHGQRVHLFERDCSSQRRHQKIVEEAPAFGVSPDVRDQMHAAALRLANAVDYRNAGTVEFLLDEENRFYFMEMNTRLQVEHPVTEAITGLDLVEWQLRVAAGEPLPLSQDKITCQGHAVEARVYAEDPQNQFLPSSGRVGVLQPPKGDYRLDASLESGDTVFPIYDPLLAKMVVSAETREKCLSKTASLLNQFVILGIQNNIRFLTQLLTDTDMVRAPVDVNFVDQHLKRWVSWEDIPLAAYRCAAVALINEIETPDPWGQRDGWRLGEAEPQRLTLENRGDIKTVSLTPMGGERWDVDNVDWIEFEKNTNSLFIQCSKAVMKAMFFIREDARCDVWFRGRSYTFKLHDVLDIHTNTLLAEHQLIAPMTSTVIAVHVKPGEDVDMGQTLMILEAMKMEHCIRAPEKGRIGDVYFQVGDVVSEGCELLAFDGGGDNAPLAQAS